MDWDISEVYVCAREGNTKKSSRLLKQMLGTGKGMKRDKLAISKCR